MTLSEPIFKHYLTIFFYTFQPQDIVLDYLKSREKSAYCHRFDAVLWSEEGSLKIHRFAILKDMHTYTLNSYFCFVFIAKKIPRAISHEEGKGTLSQIVKIFHGSKPYRSGG